MGPVIVFFPPSKTVPASVARGTINKNAREIIKPQRTRNLKFLMTVFLLWIGRIDTSTIRYDYRCRTTAY